MDKQQNSMKGVENMIRDKLKAENQGLMGQLKSQEETI